jgi:hypothetical protein
MIATSRVPYTYSVLRYVHDIGTGEFINVGVVVTAPRVSYVGAKFKLTYGRVKKAFPSLDGEAFRTRMRRLQAAFDGISEGDIAVSSRVAVTAVVTGASTASVMLAQEASTSLDSFKQSGAIERLVYSVIPRDDSSFQWSPPGSGLSKDLSATLADLYQRFVAQYDNDAVNVQRKDDDVWKHFRTELEKRNVLSHLQEKEIAVADDSVKFEHAWKNGSWHCYEPLSFDLASDASIKEKAHRWLGQVSSIKDAREEFNVFFLVGKPTDAGLHDAYEQAVSILRKAPASTVVDEEHAAEFSESVAKAISDHDTRPL